MNLERIFMHRLFTRIAFYVIASHVAFICKKKIKSNT